MSAGPLCFVCLCLIFGPNEELEPNPSTPATYFLETISTETLPVSFQENVIAVKELLAIEIVLTKTEAPVFDTSIVDDDSTDQESMATTNNSSIGSSPKIVALTFDDGPAKENTEIVLSVLEKYQAVATFFVLGERIAGNEATLKRMIQMNCEIANHTFSHLNIAHASQERVINEISRTQQLIENATGIRPRLFRPPYGSYQGRGEIIARADLCNVLWSVDTRDWQTRNTAENIRRSTTGIQSGDIILLHDIHYPSVMAVEKIVCSLQEQGFVLVTVSQLLATKNNY